MVTPHTFHPRRCCCCLQLDTVPLCEHWRQELHVTISSVVVSRYTRLDSSVVKHCTFSLVDEFGGRFRITPILLGVHLSLNLPSPPSYTFNSLVFHSRIFSTPIYATVLRLSSVVVCAPYRTKVTIDSL